MIEGMKFHVKGSELSSLLAKRAAWHKERAETLKTKNLKEAQDGMKAAASAAAAAGKTYGSDVDDVEVGDAYETLTLSAASSLRRSHGGNIEDPVAAIKKAIVFHTERASSLMFYSAHLVADASHILTENDIARFELIAASELK